MGVHTGSPTNRRRACSRRGRESQKRRRGTPRQQVLGGASAWAPLASEAAARLPELVAAPLPPWRSCPRRGRSGGRCRRAARSCPPCSTPPAPTGPRRHARQSSLGAAGGRVGGRAQRHRVSQPAGAALGDASSEPCSGTTAAAALPPPRTAAVQDEADLLVRVDVLLVEALDLGLVPRQLLRGDGHHLLQAGGAGGRRLAPAGQQGAPRAGPDSSTVQRGLPLHLLHHRHCLRTS